MLNYSSRSIIQAQDGESKLEVLYLFKRSWLLNLDSGDVVPGSAVLSKHKRVQHLFVQRQATFSQQYLSQTSTDGWITPNPKCVCIYIFLCRRRTNAITDKLIIIL